MANAYSYIKKSIRENMKSKLIDFRRGNTTEKIDKPTDIGRARKLGYKDKKGFVIIRVRIKRGGHKRPRPRKGRMVRNLTINKSLMMNYQWIAEQRASKKYPNLEILNSYKVAKDGKSYWFEIIMIDASKPEISKDKNYKVICHKKKRAYRGLTSAGRKSRGLR
jgi:large subunit ribosomal protein L15e